MKWLGHACFLLTSAKGVRVLIDPFNEKVGYPLPEVEADIVTISHGHGDHSHTAAVRGNSLVVERPGHVTVRGVEISGIVSYHDHDFGSLRGKNIIFNYRLDGLSVCHLGDLGHLLNRPHLEQIGEVDLLLVPVGGRYTIDAAEALEVVRQINPAVTIPMHFRTAAGGAALDPVDRFLELAGGGGRPGKQELEFDRDALGDYTGVVVLEYA